MSLNTLFETLRELVREQHGDLSIPPAPVYEDFRAGDIRHSQADIGKARRLLGYDRLTTPDRASGRPCRGTRRDRAARQPSSGREQREGKPCSGGESVSAQWLRRPGGGGGGGTAVGGDFAAEGMAPSHPANGASLVALAVRTNTARASR